jgi:hypothetical protein
LVADTVATKSLEDVAAVPDSIIIKAETPLRLLAAARMPRRRTHGSAWQRMAAHRIASSSRMTHGGRRATLGGHRHPRDSSMTPPGRALAQYRPSPNCAVVSSLLRMPAQPRLIPGCACRVVRENMPRRDSHSLYRSARRIAGVIHFGVATRRCVGRINSTLGPSTCQHILICDVYIARSATIRTGYQLVPQLGCAQGCAILVANAPHQAARVQPRRHDHRLRTGVLASVFAP